MTRSRIYVLATAVLLAITTAGIADEVESLRGATGIDQDSTEPQRMRYLDDQDPFARDYEEQPPLVPHTTEKYAINLDENRCLECHSWADYEEAGATRVSESHFPDSLGGVTANVAGERYFCKQCHVAQVDAEPLIENTFEPIEAAAATE
jgi:cytochrome c-type protein NapB